MPSKQVTDREKSSRAVATAGMTRPCQAAATIEALAERGGLDDLAAKVKLSGRRPGRTAAEDDGAIPERGSSGSTPPS